MTYYAVVDTNVLVSALLTINPESATTAVLKKIMAGEVIPVYSQKIIDEYRDVLYRDKFRLDGNTIEVVLKSIEKFGLYFEPSESGEILPDMKDLPFYEVVLEIKDNDGYLITGNLKHFPHKSFIVTAREFIEILEKN
jgi:uncharacterized protein